MNDEQLISPLNVNTLSNILVLRIKTIIKRDYSVDVIRNSYNFPSENQMFSNRPYSYSRYWTGTSFQLRLMRGIFSNANHMKLFLIIFPRISLHCKLVPVQYQEYEYGVLSHARDK